MKLNIKYKIKKQDVILFMCVFIFSIIANSAFLQRHYSSDTMCLINYGYFKYPIRFFLLDGRIISTLMCYLGGILDLSFDTYIFISNFIGILMLSLTVTILFKFTIKYLEIENKWIKFMTLLATYTIIVNHMSIEYLIFAESCVMCTGIMFGVIAAIMYLNSQKGKIFESFIFLLLSSLCYQGLLSIFPAIVMTLSLLKKRKDTKKEILKFYIKEIFKLGVMYVLVMLINVGIVLIFNNLLDNSTYRLERVRNIVEMILTIPYNSLDILINQTNKIPQYLCIGVMVITCVIIARNEGSLIKYVLTMFTAYLFCIIPMLAFGYAESRMLTAIGATMGISLLFIIHYLNDNKEDITIKNAKNIIVSICVIGYFIFNIINNGINSYEHLKAFKIDEENGKRINKVVKEYEESTGKEIKKIAYYHDVEEQKYEEGIKPLGPLTERKFAVPIVESLNYYCNKKLELVPFSVKVYYKYFVGKNYTKFSEEQLVFIDDTLYMCVY